MTATLALMLAIKENNKEFKERTLILIDETKEGTTTKKVEYTICQWTKTKIEIKECPFENDVKKEFSYYYAGYGDFKFKDEEFVNLLDALEIQPGDSTTINMKDLEDEIWDKFGYLLGEGEASPDYDFKCNRYNGNWGLGVGIGPNTPSPFYLLIYFILIK